IVVIFFFSSRRRHTRWPRDWSSDVCSSDLAEQREQLSLTGLLPSAVLSLADQSRRAYAQYQRQPDDVSKHIALTALHDRNEVLRSEERRVGKECRSRWGAYQRNRTE